MIDEHAPLCRNIRHDWNVACTLTKDVRSLLLLEYRKRVYRTTKEIVACLEPVSGTLQDIQETYIILKMGYHHAFARVPNYSWTHMTKVMGDYATIYWR